MRVATAALGPLAVVVVLFTGALCTAACGARAALPRPTIYVAANGSDGQAGTRRKPLRTIEAALDRAAPGTVVVVGAGIYQGRIDVTRSGGAGKPIVVRPAAGARPVIEGFVDIHASHLVFTGLRFVGRNAGNPDEVLVSIEGGDDVTLAHSELKDAAMSGVIVGDSTNIKILSNWIHDNGTHAVNGIPQDHGIYMSGSSNGVIANNIIDHNYGFGVHLYPHAVSTLVTCNTIVGNGATSGGKASGIVIGGSDSSGNTIVNNILAWNGQTAVRSLEPVGSGNAVFNNLAYGDGSGDFPPSFSGGLTEHDNVVAPPGFVDATKRNYRLQPSSPARGKALTSYLPPSDYLGRRRLQGVGSALGAFQTP